MSSKRPAIEGPFEPPAACDAFPLQTLPNELQALVAHGLSSSLGQKGAACRAFMNLCKTSKTTRSAFCDAQAYEYMIARVFGPEYLQMQQAEPFDAALSIEPRARFERLCMHYSTALVTLWSNTGTATTGHRGLFFGMTLPWETPAAVPRRPATPRDAPWRPRRSPDPNPSAQGFPVTGRARAEESGANDRLARAAASQGYDVRTSEAVHEALKRAVAQKLDAVGAAWYGTRCASRPRPRPRLSARSGTRTFATYVVARTARRSPR